jgi:hypothetical protein
METLLRHEEEPTKEDSGMPAASDMLQMTPCIVTTRGNMWVPDQYRRIMDPEEVPSAPEEEFYVEWGLYVRDKELIAPPIACKFHAAVAVS